MSFISKVKLRYVSIEFPEFDIHLRTLKDKQQFSDDDKISEEAGINSTLWPIFGVVWESGRVMAQLMCHQKIENLKILEVGCGIGLSSLVLSRRGADITATDYHPEAKIFLEKNVELNKAKKIDFHLCDWKDTTTTLGKYDLIIGSDLVYEQTHPKLLSSFIDMHTKPNSEVMIVGQKREYQNQFNKKMVSLSYSHDKIKFENTEQLKTSCDVFINRYQKI